MAYIIASVISLAFPLLLGVAARSYCHWLAAPRSEREHPETKAVVKQFHLPDAA